MLRIVVKKIIRSVLFVSEFIKPEIFRFLVVGGFITLIHVVVAIISSYYFNLGNQISNLTGYLVAVFASYFGHSFFTFNATKDHARQAPKFFIVSILGFFTSSTITFLVCNLMQGSMFFAMILVAIFVPVVTFLGSKFWVFSKSASEANGGSQI